MGAFRMTIRDAFRCGGEKGTVLTGRVEAGRVCVGDSVEIVIRNVAPFPPPTQTRTTVHAIEVHQELVGEASVGQVVALAITDVDGLFPFGGDLVRGCE
jgi:translation elongation factor EF-Tu-like GTPase